MFGSRWSRLLQTELTINIREMGHFRCLQKIRRFMSRTSYFSQSSVTNLNGIFSMSYSASVNQETRSGNLNRFPFVDSSKQQVGLREDEQVCINTAIFDRLLKSLPEREQRHLLFQQLEVDLLQESGQMIPKRMTEYIWLQLMKQETAESKVNFLQAVAEAEQRREQNFENDRREMEEMLRKFEVANSSYKNIIHYNKDSQKLLGSHRVAHAMQYGPDIIIDLDFENHMSAKSIRKVAEQIWYTYMKNLRSSEPFHLRICNVDFAGQIMKTLYRQRKGILLPKERVTEPFHVQVASKDFSSPSVEDYFRMKRDPIIQEEMFDSMMATVTEKDFTELFPREQLVYISKYATEMMTHYDHNATYIIGGLVQGRKHAQVKHPELAKAKRRNIKIVKMPTDKYLKREKGRRSLAITELVTILLEVKKTQDFAAAFEHVLPGRVLKFPEEVDIRMASVMGKTKD